MLNKNARNFFDLELVGLACMYDYGVAYEWRGEDVSGNYLIVRSVFQEDGLISVEIGLNPREILARSHTMQIGVYSFAFDRESWPIRKLVKIMGWKIPEDKFFIP